MNAIAIEIALGPAAPLDRLEAEWRALEQRAELSFFQSWTWIGCLAEERFTDPVLLRGTRDGATVAMALFNRRGRRLLLAETGDPERDSVFVEHNGPVIARDAGDDAPVTLLAALARTRTTLSGIDDGLLRRVRDLPGATRIGQTRPAPHIEFAALPPGPFLESLSANARYQIRRSDRGYAKHGELTVRPATTATEAHAFLDALAALHQRHWTARGRPGAFAGDGFTRFHRALIDRAWPAREIDVLRIEAGAKPLGYLYNFVHRGHVYAYQSGFDYARADPHEKPGLTCHRLAIEFYRAAGMRRYDFLAGDDRYKTSFANATTNLHWIEYLPRYSAGWLAAAGRAAGRAVIGR